MSHQELGASGEVILRFNESFDISAARDLGTTFRRVSAGKRIVLDFTQTRDLDYYGLSVVANIISNSAVPVSLLGLNQNHVRMLRYFGLDPACLGISDLG
jgi:hypothetical protein